MAVDPKALEGSPILNRWRAQREAERAIAAEQRRGMRPRRDAGFAGAAINRLTASLAQWSGSVNADLDSALVILRSRARSLCANNEYGRRFLSMVAQNVVGPGFPKLQVRAKNTDGTLDKSANDAIEYHFARWGRMCDVGGRMTFSHMLRVGVKGAARDGEALIRVVRNRAFEYGMKLQLLEADRLDEALNTRTESGNVVRQGVEIDSMMRPTAYWLKILHPGENYTSTVGAQKWERVPARDLYHVFIQERAEQVRGYTWFHAVLQRMSMLHGYEEAAVVAARVGASKMGVFTRKDDAPSTLTGMADSKDPTTGALNIQAEPGEFFELPQGYSLESWNPEYPHANFESFLKQCLRGLATGLDVAAHNLSADMTGVNYSSARIAELDERDAWVVLQDWLFDTTCIEIYKDWLASALIRGDITFLDSGKTLPAERLSKFADVSRFQGRRWAWVDPQNEVASSVELINNRLASRTEIAASQGREFDDIVRELADEEKQMADAGIEPAPVKKPSTQEKPAAGGKESTP